MIRIRNKEMQCAYGSSGEMAGQQLCTLATMLQSTYKSNNTANQQHCEYMQQHITVTTEALPPR